MKIMIDTFHETKLAFFQRKRKGGIYEKIRTIGLICIFDLNRGIEFSEAK